jgi:quercetin dioxygenase-like cupin family protein
MTQEPDDIDELIARWDRRLAQAGDALDTIAPSPEVWDRISARVDALESGRATLTVAAEGGVWEVVSPGVRRKLLRVDAAGGWQAFLLRIDAGGQVPPHSHAGLEECLVLEGSFEVEGELVRKGDLHLAFAGRDHAELVSPSGALLYIRSASVR